MSEDPSKPARILFIARSWWGTGGLQQLNRDLWQGIMDLYRQNASVCHPSTKGMLSLCFFLWRAFLSGLVAGLRGAHIHVGDGSLVPLAALIRLLTGARVTATVAGLDVIFHPWWYQTLIRWSLPCMDRVCCISEATAAVVRDRGVEENKIVVIPCGIRTSDVLLRREREEHHAPVLVSVCRLIPRKGIVWFTENVMPRLLEKYPDLTYTIVGDGPQAERIATIIRTHNLQNSVILHGSGDDSARDALLVEADLFVMPNIKVEGDMEGFGIACIEASARGLPVAASRLEGISDAVIEGKTGRFYRSGDSANAVEVIDALLQSPLDPIAVARTTAEQYDWSRLFARYHDEIFV